MQTISLSDARKLLEEAQNPFFLYDHDADGFCSMVLLHRWLGRGAAEVVRSHPNVAVRYADKVVSHGADLVVVLDRPVLTEDFVAQLEAANVRVLWIDHHAIPTEHFSDSVFYYNPLAFKKQAIPVTGICYSLTRRREDMWIAMMGCIADHYLPSFASSFKKKFPSFWGSVKQPFDAYFSSEIGVIARGIGFGIKGSLSEVRSLEKFFISCMSPEQARDELQSESPFAVHIRTLSKKYKELYARAAHSEKRMVFFKYSGERSMNAELANELSYRFPNKFIIVAYVNAGSASISLRGKKVLSLLEQILPFLSGASGGGHPDASGARIRASLLDDFKKRFEELL